MSVTTQNPCLDMPPPILLSLDSNLPKPSINDTAASFTSGDLPLSSPSSRHRTTSHAQPASSITYLNINPTPNPTTPFLAIN